jgi:hypothetical protein
VAPTKTKSRTKSPLLEEVEPQPLAAPETDEQRFKRIADTMYKPNPPKETRDELRALLAKAPDLALQFGTLPSMARSRALDRYKSFPVLQESIRFQLKQLRKDLAGEQASPLEVLLIEAVVCCYQDYFSFFGLANQNTAGQTTLDAIDKWERILSSKEARYLRAVAELARVRRLLNLPAPQINVNMPGGQQVNVQGKP